MNYDLRAVHRYQHLRAAGFVLCALLSPFSVSAAEVVAQDSAFQRFMRLTTGLGRQTITYGGGGTPIPSLPPHLSVGSAGVNVSRAGSFPLRTGVTLAFQTVARVPGVSTALTIGKFLGAATGPLVMASFVAQLIGEFGYTPTLSEDDRLVLKKPQPGICSIGPCYEYATRTHTNSSGEATGYKPTQGEACEVARKLLADANAAYPVTVSIVSSAPSCNLKVANTNGSGTPTLFNWAYTTRNVPPTPGSWAEVPMQTFLDELAQKSGWPTTSTLAAALNDAQRYTGDVLPVEDVKITGPATVTGPEEVTKETTPTGEKTTTKQSDYECTYVDGATVMDGGDVICTERIRTKEELETTDPVTQEKKKTTTKTEETKKPADPAENPTDCSKTPDASGCVKNEYDVPEGKIPTATKTITFSPINLGFSAGSCPADAVFTPHGMGPLKVIDWADNCSKIRTYVKPMILALATFGALMILFAGGRPE